MQPDPVANMLPQPRRSLSPRQGILLIAIVLLVIAGSTGLFYVVRSNQIVNEHASATASVQSRATAHTNATASVISQEATASMNTATAPAYATATTIARATAIPYGSYKGVVALNDSLSDTGSGGWSGCTFTGGALHSTAPIGQQTFCFATNTDFYNFAYEVHMTIVQGGFAGIIFRAPLVNGLPNGYYSFLIAANGSYQLGTDVVSNSFSAAITTGLNQPNLIAVVAHDHKIDIYVNKQFVVSGRANGTWAGSIGITAISTSDSPTEAVFSNAKVWELM